jgi:hypothetical protein
MIEIKVPANPPGAPEQLFLQSLIHYVDTEPRLAKPVSVVAVAMRLVDAADEARESGVLSLRDGDHQLLCQLIETSEVSFLMPLVATNEAGEKVDAQINPRIERAFVATILKAKPVEPVEQVAAE